MNTTVAKKRKLTVRKVQNIFSKVEAMLVCFGKKGNLSINQVIPIAFMSRNKLVDNFAK